MGESIYRPATEDELAAEQLPPDPSVIEESWARSVTAALTETRVPAGWGPAPDRDPID
jgi:hypothetical protein